MCNINVTVCALTFVAQDDDVVFHKLLCLTFRNQSQRTQEEQLAYADQYRNEEALAVAQQLELVCSSSLHFLSVE